jgi:hypothetical protein
VTSSLLTWIQIIYSLTVPISMDELLYMNLWNTNKFEIEMEIKVRHLHCVMYCELCTTTQKNRYICEEFIDTIRFNSLSNM